MPSMSDVSEDAGRASEPFVPPEQARSRSTPSATSSRAAGWGAFPLQLDSKRRVLVVIGIATAAPWLITMMLLVLFMYVYHSHAKWVLAFAALCHTVPFSLTVLFAVNRRRPLVALAMTQLLAGVLGTAGGIVNDEAYMKPYWDMRSAPALANLDPLGSSHNSSLATAGQLEFIDGTFVDDRRTLGYVSKGEIHCVAPVVRPPNYTNNISFWAAGVGCCEMRSNFMCGSREPQAGAFVAFRVQLSTEKFLAAAREALSVYGLQHKSDGEMFFLMSEKEAHALEDELLSQAKLVCAIFGWSSLILYFTMSVVIMRKVLHASTESAGKLPLRADRLRQAGPTARQL